MKLLPSEDFLARHGRTSQRSARLALSTLLDHSDGDHITMEPSIRQAIVATLEWNDKLAHMLYDACGGFPVSQSAFAVVSKDYDRS